MNEVIHLKKNEVIQLKKKSDPLNKIIVGLGWDVKKTSGHDFDLDVSCLLLDKNMKLTDANNFIFYNNKSDMLMSVVHTGDDRSGGNSEDGDDEQIKIDFSKIDNRVNHIIFLITIHDALQRRQFFGQVDNAYVRVVDELKNKELLRLNLTEHASKDISLHVCQLNRSPEGDWYLETNTRGYQYMLDGILNMYYSAGATY